MNYDYDTFKQDAQGITESESSSRLLHIEHWCAIEEDWFMKGYVENQLRGHNRGYADNQMWLMTKQIRRNTNKIPVLQRVGVTREAT